MPLWRCIKNTVKQTPPAQLKPTAMIRLWSSRESDVVQLWLDGWLVGRSGYIGMQGLLFVWERSGSGRECHWWLQRRRMNLQEVFSLSLSPDSPALILSVSLSLSFFFCVWEPSPCRASLCWGHSPQAQPLLCLALWTHTHPSSTGCLRLPGPGKHRATAPILIHITAPAWMECLCGHQCLNGELFFVCATHLTKHLVCRMFSYKWEIIHSLAIFFRERDSVSLTIIWRWPRCRYPPVVPVTNELKME